MKIRVEDVVFELPQNGDPTKNSSGDFFLDDAELKDTGGGYCYTYTENGDGTGQWHWWSGGGNFWDFGARGTETGNGIWWM